MKLFTSFISLEHKPINDNRFTAMEKIILKKIMKKYSRTSLQGTSGDRPKTSVISDVCYIQGRSQTPH